jgi:hypothetical protein
MFADAIASVVSPFQRMVHLFQQMEQVCGLGFGHCGLQLLPADHQLVAQHVKVGYLDRHGITPCYTESFRTREDSDFSLLATACFVQYAS